MMANDLRLAVKEATIARELPTCNSATAWASDRAARFVACRKSNRNRGEASETYQNNGKLSLSSDSQYSSSISRSRSRGFLPSLCDGVFLRVMAGRVALCLEAGSVTVTAFFTSVYEVLAEALPDFLLW